MTKQYDVAIVFGRFQPLHNQHIELFNQAAELADRVIIMVGSAGRPRTPKNPFTFPERAELIQRWASSQSKPNSRVSVCIAPVQDHMYSDQTWVEEVQRTVATLTADITTESGEALRVAVVGCIKDESSFYLKMFPQWTLVECPYEDKVDATQIRELVFNGRSLSFVSGVMPQYSVDFIREFQNTPTFQHLLHERNVIARYQEAWSVAPYPPTFVTADACVIHSGHVLLVRRKSAPGKNLMALPGGFVNQNETVETAIFRELKEETKIKVAVPVLKGSLREIKVFDNPNRSARGRTITHAGLIVLSGDELPKVKGSDDAAYAGWYPLGSLNSEDFFDDHWDMIQYFKSRV